MSAIVAVVLIVLVTVVAVGVIWGMVIPMIQQDSGLDTYDADVIIKTDGGYTYFDEEKGVACVQVKRIGEGRGLRRIDVLFSYDGATLDDNGNFSGEELPDVNGMKQKCFDLTNIIVQGADGKYIAPDSITIVPIYFDGSKEIEGTVSKIDRGRGLTSGKFLDYGSAESVGGCEDDSGCSAGVCYNEACYSDIIVGGKVDNCWQLQNINLGLTEDYILMKDLNCSMTSTWNGGDGFDPIGNDPNVFAGTFDGQGFTISDLYIDRPSENYVGLFGYVSGGEIKNVGLVDVIILGANDVGGLVGDSHQSLIDNSYVTGAVTGSNSRVGGLVGYSRTASLVNNSYAAVEVSGTRGFTGGLVGYNYYSSVDNSYATGTVLGRVARTGGLVGYSREAAIDNSYATGTVVGEAYVGGLAGGNQRSSINNSYASGNVRGVDYIIGGLVGYNSQSTINNSYAIGNVVGAKSTGGLSGNNHQAAIINSYAIGDVSGTEYVGGLVGSADFYPPINNSYATGAVSGSRYVGGLVGGSSSGSTLIISDSYWNNHYYNPSVGCGNSCDAVIMAISDDEGWFYVEANAPMNAWSSSAWTWSGTGYPKLIWE